MSVVLGADEEPETQPACRSNTPPFPATDATMPAHTRNRLLALQPAALFALSTGSVVVLTCLVLGCCPVGLGWAARLGTLAGLVGGVGMLVCGWLLCRSAACISAPLADSLRGADHSGRLQVGVETVKAATPSGVESGRAKHHFLVRLSHEVRTPLGGILGMTELLRDTPLTAEQSRHLDTIHQSAETVLAVFAQVIEFAQREAAEGVSGAPSAILVVLAAEQERHALVQHLTAWGYQAVGVPTGRAALAALLRAVVEGNSFALVLVAEHLPDLSAREVLRRLRERVDCPPLAILLGHSEKDLPAPSGFAAVLSRPAVPAELRQAVRQALARSDARVSERT